MTREEKELLLKDLCARLPYGVKCQFKDRLLIVYGEANPYYDYVFSERHIDLFRNHKDLYIKPYLRPMSSMTEEEVKEFYEVECIDAKVGYIKPAWNWHFTINGIDWLNAHHFDFRNLIERGLAIDCTDLNVY